MTRFQHFVYSLIIEAIQGHQIIIWTFNLFQNGFLVSREFCIIALEATIDCTILCHKIFIKYRIVFVLFFCQCYVNHSHRWKFLQKLILFLLLDNLVKRGSPTITVAINVLNNSANVLLIIIMYVLITVLTKFSNVPYNTHNVFINSVYMCSNTFECI